MKSSKHQLAVNMWLYFRILYPVPLVYVSSFIPKPCCFVIRIMFSNAVGFGWLMFCWGFLHLCALGILAYSFLFYMCVLIWFYYEGNTGLVEWIRENSLLLDFWE